MARQIKSPTRTISNRGPMPRYIGYFPCSKTVAPYLPFDSIASLCVGIYLEWSRDTVALQFESAKFQFQTADGVKTVIPDYEVSRLTGEIRHAEAKYERPVDPGKTQELEATAALFASRGIPYEVFFRKDLERDGFFDTIFFLRRYAKLWFYPNSIATATRKMSCVGALTVWEYKSLALERSVPLALLYHILYHGHLPFKPEPFVHEEFRECHV
jgi:hypothetical protein